MSDYLVRHPKPELVALLRAAPAWQPPTAHDINDINDKSPRDDEARSFLSVSVTSSWPVLHPAALYGPVGEFVRVVGPQTESDPVALVLQLLIAFGNMVGRRPFYQVGTARHHVNEYGVLVGPTGAGRKGQSWSDVRHLCVALDSDWTDERVTSGMASGEGFVDFVRDERIGRDGVSVVDRGVMDKRAFWVETEFTSVLKVMARPGSTLSNKLRQAWDTGDIRVSTKNDPARATGAHCSLVGHVTADDLTRELTTVDMANGFANRLCFALVKRSKLLPDGGCIDPTAFATVLRPIQHAYDGAREMGEMTRDEGARALWHRAYARLSSGRPGLFGAVRNRAEAHVVRLSMIYALLDRSRIITKDHLRAALALWQYCEDSAAMIFGARVGHALADHLLAALRTTEDGLTRTQIRDLYGRNKSADEIDRALTVLVEYGLASRTMEPRDQGRPTERWRATRYDTDDPLPLEDETPSGPSGGGAHGRGES